MNSNERECRCSQSQILKYQSRVSGPLLDRIDIQVGVTAVPVNDLQKYSAGTSSEKLRSGVVRARNMQKERYRDMPGIHTNAEARSRDLPDICKLDAKSLEAVRDAVTQLKLSARAYDRVLRVARTIADLEGKDAVELEHVNEAIGYRQLDDQGRGFWA